MLPLLSRGYNLYITCEQHIDFTTGQLEGGGGGATETFSLVIIIIRRGDVLVLARR